jgi:hypothetical protein
MMSPFLSGMEHLSSSCQRSAFSYQSILSIKCVAAER